MSSDRSPSLDALRARLAEPLSSALGTRVAPEQISLLMPAKPVPDDPQKLRVVDARGRPVAVVLSAARSAPALVAESLRRAREAKAALGPEVGSVILDPLAEGDLDGVSWGALVHCDTFTRVPGLRRLQRSCTAPRLLTWLEDVVRLTVREPGADDLTRDFIAPLEHLAAQPRTSPRMRAVAGSALERIGRGAWRPRYVLAHNDLWEGNVLFRPFGGRSSRYEGSGRYGGYGGYGRYGRYGRCVIIDWPASRLYGHAMLDLARLWLSFRLARAKFRAVVANQCRLLGCELVDAQSHLIGALARLRMKLDHFPEENFVRMGEACLEAVDSACGSRAR